MRADGLHAFSAMHQGLHPWRTFTGKHRATGPARRPAPDLFTSMLVDGRHGRLFESVRVRRAQRRPWRAPAWPWSSIFPEVLEAARREFRVSHGVRDVPMLEVPLQGPGVRPLVGESLAGRVSEHMRMRFDLKAGRLAGRTTKSRAHRRASFASYAAMVDRAPAPTSISERRRKKSPATPHPSAKPTALHRSRSRAWRISACMIGTRQAPNCEFLDSCTRRLGRKALRRLWERK